MPNQELLPLVLTIGHSTRTIDEFIHLLRVHGATCVVDVRTVPRSAHNPQFNQDSLARSLMKFSLKYVHMPGLGGLRHAMRDSLNGGWRNASFRGYADYMQTQERGIRTEDIMSATRRQIHTLTPFAQVRGTTITYPAETSHPIPTPP
jgi:uncharacterized protein (DUF488 family)